MITIIYKSPYHYCQNFKNKNLINFIILGNLKDKMVRNVESACISMNVSKINYIYT